MYRLYRHISLQILRNICRRLRLVRLRRGSVRTDHQFLNDVKLFYLYFKMVDPETAEAFYSRIMSAAVSNNIDLCLEECEHVLRLLS